MYVLFGYIDTLRDNYAYYCLDLKVIESDLERKLFYLFFKWWRGNRG